MTVSENYIFFSSEFIEFVICIYVLPWFKYLVTSERQTTVVAFYGWNQVKKKLFLLKSLKNSNKYLFQKKELKNKSFWKFYNNYWINFAYNALDPNLISCILTNYKVNLWIFIFLVWCFFLIFILGPSSVMLKKIYNYKWFWIHLHIISYIVFSKKNSNCLEHR